MENKLDGFEDELIDLIKHCKFWSTFNYVFAHLVFAGTVLSSFISAVFVGIGDTNDFKVWLAIATALPATLLLVNTTLRFEDRAQWFWKKRLGAQRFLRELRGAEDAEIQLVVKRFADFSDTMESTWPDFGTP